MAAAEEVQRKNVQYQTDFDPPPGLYTCQVNIVDDVAGTFAFPGIALYVRPAAR